ncbi:hypothetical protein ACERIT_02825 [Halopenitus sp. H-Gu1]|uniref:hypothetical protein n=1 Tax=Halopenitus sp. H-Gu1 TaxID=3242697 RepID=UPI00359DC0DC
MVDYYDQILIGTAVAIVAGVSVSIHPAVAIYQGLAGGSLIATVLLLDTLFRNPPTEPTPSKTISSILLGICWLLSILLYL